MRIACTRNTLIFLFFIYSPKPLVFILFLALFFVKCKSKRGKDLISRACLHVDILFTPAPPMCQINIWNVTHKCKSKAAHVICFHFIVKLTRPLLDQSSIFSKCWTQFRRTVGLVNFIRPNITIFFFGLSPVCKKIMS